MNVDVLLPSMPAVLLLDADEPGTDFGEELCFGTFGAEAKALLTLWTALPPMTGDVGDDEGRCFVAAEMNHEPLPRLLSLGEDVG